MPTRAHLRRVAAGLLASLAQLVLATAAAAVTTGGGFPS